MTPMTTQRPAPRPLARLAALPLALTVALSAALSAAPARAAPVVVHHALASAEPGRDALIACTIREDWSARAFWVEVRPLGASGAYERYALLRTSGLEFAAIVPAARVQPPGLEYWIGATDADGATVAELASAERPHPVLVVGETEETRHAARLARHGGRTSMLEAGGEVSFYGRRATPDGAVTEALTDWMWQTDVAYTHRFLRTLYDIRFGVEIARGHLPEVALEGGGTAPVTDGRRDAGINLGYGQLDFELDRYLGIGARLLLGASDQGFALGAGAVLRVGHLGGTRLELGGELLADLGNRGWLGFTWTTIPKVPMGLTIELGTRPGGDHGAVGARLLYDLGVEVLPGFTVTGRLGYAARGSGVEGGFVGGLGARFEY